MTNEQIEGFRIEINDLAFKLDELNRKINEADPTCVFIERFCVPTQDSSEISAAVSYEELFKLYRGTDTQQVYVHLKRLSYNDFLFTAYWKIITAHVKSKKGSHCCACPVTDGLEVHHRTYENHGREIETWESDLNPFCGRCHSIFHTVTNKTIPNGDFVALERKSGRHPNRHPGRQRFNSDAEVMPA